MKKFLFALLGIFLLAAGGIYYKNNYSRPYLTVVGFVRMADGLGRQTAELIDAFKDEMSVGFIPTHRNRYQDVPKGILKIIKNKKRPLGKVILMEDTLWYPGHDPKKKLQGGVQEDQIRIAYSMFESSRIPPEWTEILNTHFDAVAVPDSFLVKVYQDSGVKLPIFVIPLAIDITPFLDLPLKEKANIPFTFANLSNCTNRKNHITLIRAFAQAFGNDERVRLLINSRNSFDHFEKILFNEVEKLGLTNVQINIKSLPKKEYLALFQTIDCYVNLAKGEGFSIQPREAMALGIPAIVTDNTAQSTLVASGLVSAVRSDNPEPATYNYGMPYGYYYLCTVDDAAKAMKEVYDNYPTYLARKEETRAFAAKYQYNKLKPLYRTLIKPEKIVLGKENRIDGDTLTTNSKALYKKYKQL